MPLVVDFNILLTSNPLGLQIVPFVPNILRDRAGVPDDDRMWMRQPIFLCRNFAKTYGAANRCHANTTVQLWNSVLVGVYGAAIFVGSRRFPCQIQRTLLDGK